MRVNFVSELKKPIQVYVLLYLILLSILLPTLITPVRASSAIVRGKRITVFVGTEVTVYIKVKTGTYRAIGTLKVEVRKDIVWYPDETHKVLEKSIDVPANTISDWINMGTFIAEDLTSDSPGSVRQYFIKVWFAGELIYDPTDPTTRECVFTKSGEVSYYEGEFEGEG